MRGGYKAWFVNMLGHKFSMELDTQREFDYFVDKAAAIGTRLIAFVSSDFQGREEEARDTA